MSPFPDFLSIQTTIPLHERHPPIGLRECEEANVHYQGRCQNKPKRRPLNANLPVIGVPVQSRALSGLDSLLSIAQMPGGIPVATMAIGTSGAKNAAILAARILALSDEQLRSRLEAFVQRQSDAVIASGEL